MELDPVDEGVLVDRPREVTITATAGFIEWAAKREGGSVEPSRTTAIGGTRVAPGSATVNWCADRRAG